jgi:hypothetical protein
MVTDAKLLQSEKAPTPTEVTPAGMITDKRLLQPEKASLPIEVTLDGMVIANRLLHLANILSIDNQQLIH